MTFTPLTLAAVLALAARPAGGDRYEDQVRPFLARHCQACHGPEKPKGDFRADRLTPDFADAANRDRWLAAVERVRAVTRNYAELLGRSPHLATAANMALLGTDPEVERLRLVIGAELVNRFRDAIGADADRRVLDALTFAFSGALLQTGMGLMTYDELSARLDDVVAAIMEGH